MKKRIKQATDQVYLPQETSDNTQELLDKAREATSRMVEEARVEIRHMEQMKQNRILATKEDKYIHAINTILERMGNAGDTNSCTIDYFDFNFEDRLSGSLFEPFLNKLKNEGCFTDWTKRSFVRRCPYSFSEVNTDRLKDYKTKLVASSPQDRENLDIKNLFGFEGTKFWLRRVAGESLTISFHPKRGGTTNPFCLMQAFISYLRSHGESDNGWLKVVVPVKEITDYLEANYPNLKPNEWKSWIKNTKNNLLKKMTDEDKKLVFIEDFDKQAGGYPISIKLPQPTPQLHQV